jgi:hypothetical protein
VFGFSWLRKAVLRTAGIKALRDEAAIYIRQIDEMRSKLHAGLGDGLNVPRGVAIAARTMLRRLSDESSR